MASQISTKLSALLTATRDKLLTDGVVPEGGSFLSLRMNPPYMGLHADQYAITLPLSQYADQKSVDGGGRYNTVIRGRMNVYPRNRTALDEAYKADVWLADPNFGILDFCGAIINSIHLQWIVDSDGNALVVEPPRLIFWGEPKQRYDRPEWGDVVVEFEICYELSLDTSIE